MRPSGRIPSLVAAALAAARRSPLAGAALRPSGRRFPLVAVLRPSGRRFSSVAAVRPAGRRFALVLARSSRRRPFFAVAALVPLVLGGCTAEAKQPDTPSPFGSCAELTASPAAANGSAAVPDLPDLRLPCFTGGQTIGLRDLRGPAVINIWASWCDPCRRELPVMQRLADEAGDRLTVLGVDTGDRRDAGASFAADKKVTMPTLFDSDRKLINALARINLPITIFVDAAGKSYVNLLPLGAPELTEMVRTHTGVTVQL